MEYPGKWTLLISSLAVSDLSDPAETWAFLAAQGLVRDHDSNYTTFVTLVEQERQAPPHPGPSLAYRVAGGLVERGLATWLGHLPDPHGILARFSHRVWRRFRR